MRRREEKTQKSNEKVEAAENKPQTAKGQPAELLNMGSNPIPGSKPISIWDSKRSKNSFFDKQQYRLETRIF